MLTILSSVSCVLPPLQIAMSGGGSGHLTGKTLFLKSLKEGYFPRVCWGHEHCCCMLENIFQIMLKQIVIFVFKYLVDFLTDIRIFICELYVSK